MTAGLTAFGRAKAAPFSSGQFERRGLFVVTGAKPGQDALGLIREQIARCALNGGGRVVLPPIGGYTVSDTIVVDFSNCEVVLQDDVRLTKTHPSDESPQTVFLFRGTVDSFIENVSLVGFGVANIDGNGDEVLGYKHEVGKNHHAVLFTRCKNIEIRGVHVTNGLVGCITTLYVLGGRISECEVSRSRYDNGIYIFGNGEGIVPFDQGDEKTWCGILCQDCIAHDCANFGMGIFGAVGVKFSNPIIYSCGNNSGSAIAGPQGGFGAEFDVSINESRLRDHRLTVENPNIYDCWGHCVFNNVRGSRFLGGVVRGAKVPTNYRDGHPFMWGHNFYIQNGAEDTYISSTVLDAARSGIRLNGDAATGAFPSLIFDGLVQDCGGSAIEGYGVSSVVVRPSSRIIGNGDKQGLNAGKPHAAIHISNQPSNTSLGRVVVGGNFIGNHGRCGSVVAIGHVELSGIRGTDNLSGFARAKGRASAFEVIGFTAELIAKDIQLEDRGRRTKHQLWAFDCGAAYIDTVSIGGDRVEPRSVWLSPAVSRRGVYQRVVRANYISGGAGTMASLVIPGVRSGDVVRITNASPGAFPFEAVKAISDGAIILPESRAEPRGVVAVSLTASYERSGGSGEPR